MRGTTLQEARSKYGRGREAGTGETQPARQEGIDRRGRRGRTTLAAAAVAGTRGRSTGTLLAAPALLLVATIGCAARQPVQTVMVPPRVDLRQLELIGVVEFKSPTGGKLGPLATKKFSEWARRDQGMVRIIDLGSSADALRSVSRDRWEPETFRELGRQHGVKSILKGELTVSNVRPDIRVLASSRSGQVSAHVDAMLTVQLIETATGASLWSASASQARTLGQVSLFGGRNVSFDAEDPEKAYGDLVDALVEEVTRDLRVTWETR